MSVQKLADDLARRLGSTNRSVLPEPTKRLIEALTQRPKQRETEERRRERRLVDEAQDIE